MIWVLLFHPHPSGSVLVSTAVRPNVYRFTCLNIDQSYLFSMIPTQDSHAKLPESQDRLIQPRGSDLIYPENGLNVASYSTHAEASERFPNETSSFSPKPSAGIPEDENPNFRAGPDSSED